MPTFQLFEQTLREVVAHLYDPGHRPPDRAWWGMGLDPRQGLDVLWETVLRAIKDLKPADQTPPAARIRRIYALLNYRYVENLSQEGAAERLGITARHLRREQLDALHVLALRLWAGSEPAATEPAPAAEGVDDLAADESTAELDPPEWRAQLRQELATLHEGAPAAVASLNEIITTVAALGRALTDRRGITLLAAPPVEEISVAMHPAALRQVLLAAIAELAGRMTQGQLAVRAQRHAEGVRLTVEGAPIPAQSRPDTRFIQDLLDVPGGIASVEGGAEGVVIHIDLPAVEHVVLVVDDNLDMAHLYRRYLTGTGFYMIHAAQGQHALVAAESSAPAVIVLDVMLPDVDGWALLTQMHEHPALRAVPIIVCSVVREEELALALGAAAYLRKPISREAFLGALDEAVTPPRV